MIMQIMAFLFKFLLYRALQRITGIIAKRSGTLSGGGALAQGTGGAGSDSVPVKLVVAIVFSGISSNWLVRRLVVPGTTYSLQTKARHWPQTLQYMQNSQRDQSSNAGMAF